MPERETKFPSSIVLNGIDNFLLQLDRMMQNPSGMRNVCTFVVTLKERLDHQELNQILSANPAYQWVSQLRLRKAHPFALAKWIADTEVKPPEIHQYLLSNNERIPESLLATALDIENQAPFKIDLLQVSGAGSILIFTWYHPLMDAHGGELFIQYFGALPASKQPVWIKPKPHSPPLIKQLKIAREMKQFLYETSKLPLLSLYTKNTSAPSLRYRVLSFTEQQSQDINTRARQHGAGFLASTFYLAATACALAHIQQQRSPLNGDVLVPVPQDRRLRGAQGPIIGNQVTFLFYRIPETALSSLQTCTTALIEQMTLLMRAQNPGEYLIMMDLLRRIPGPIYRFLLKSPTSGLMGSFFYSDTGDSLQDFTELFGRKVEKAIHYPPNAQPPGITFVFSRFKGTLQLTLGYMDQVINEHEVELLLKQLCSALLGTDNEKRQ